MTRYIALLRGINVLGRNMIRMKDLEAMFTGMGFASASTYIQSGNVLFEGPSENNAALAERISGEIQAVFGFTVPVLVLGSEEIRRVAAGNPFLAGTSFDETKLHVTFLDAEPLPATVGALEPSAFLPEEFRIKAKAVYLFCPDGYGNAKLNNAFLERKLKVRATTRNWKTVLELAKRSI